MSETTESITIPLRGGDLVLTLNDVDPSTQEDELLTNLEPLIDLLPDKD